MNEVNDNLADLPPEVARAAELLLDRKALDVTVLARGTPDVADHVVRLVERGRHLPVDVGRVVALDGEDVVAVAAQQALELVAVDAGRDRRVRDLPAVEAQDRQHRSVVDRVDELVAVPARRQRTGLELAVADHGRDDEVGVVHGGAVGVGQDVAELAALVDRSRRLRCDVARDPARERELPEEPAQPLLVVADLRVDLGVRALEVRVRDERRAAVAGAGDVERDELAFRELRRRNLQPVAERESDERVREDVISDLLRLGEVVNGEQPEATRAERRADCGRNEHPGEIPDAEERGRNETALACVRSPPDSAGGHKKQECQKRLATVHLNG